MKPKLSGQVLMKTNNAWFEDSFTYQEISKGISGSSNDVSKRLIQILSAAKRLNPSFLNTNKGFKVITEIDFPKNWGLGTSSTLINSIANWANVDAYKLLEKTFGGSGYDIACAENNSPIIYELNKSNSVSNSIQNNNKRKIETVNFNPVFKDNLFFIYLNKKQNSRESIANYKTNKSNLSKPIEEINKITDKIIKCDSLSEFEDLITKHEYIISKIIKQKTVKEHLFKDYKGAIKSLGAWGGDFILATGTKTDMSYFKDKGYTTILSYQEMVLS